MSEHINRKREIFHGIIPPEGTAAYKKVVEDHDRMVAANPHLKKIFKDNYEKAVKTGIVQNSNGIDVGMDQDIRYFLREFNSRLLEHGLRSMPTLFNIMEAFFNYDKSIIYFQLLEEEDYLISFYDFLDYYTSKNFNGDTESILESLEEELIYNYNVGADLETISFKTEDGKAFIISGVSMIRRGSEVTVLFQAGEIKNVDREIDFSKLYEDRIITPGKEKIVDARKYEYKAVALNNDNRYWKSLIICRFDLETNTIDGRYVAKDLNDAFIIETDDISGFLDDGKFISEDVKTAYESTITEIEKYNPIFEIAKAALYIPGYFNVHEDAIISETHETKYKELTNHPLKKREYKMVDNKFKLSTRNLFILNQNNKFSPDRLQISDDNFRIDRTGYWKKLNPDEFGMDKKGNQITGKTWVNRQDSYYESKTETVIVTSKTERRFSGPNAGSIYVMRNPLLPKNTFKIGLTTKTPQERADQLSNTSIPDRHYVMKEWDTADCKKAEAEIHEILKIYRVDLRREYFTADMDLICRTIQDVVSKINEE